MNWKRYVLTLLLLLALGLLVHVSLQTPQLDRAWAADQAVLPTAEWQGDAVTIRNVRDFRYSSTQAYDVRYYDTTLELADLERVDYIVEPFGSVGAAHTFLSFGFAGGEQIAISVEIRKEVNETFSPLQGVLRQYELMYVIADERDVVDLRVNHRGNDVYLYPTVATPAQGRQLLRSMLDRANALAESPEFYNTVTNNCATNIAAHLNEFLTEPIGADYRLLLPAYSDALAHERGLIAPGLTLAAARERYQINEVAAHYQGADDFSARIRDAVLPTTTATIDELAVRENTASTQPSPVSSPATTWETARVVRVIDGDTIVIDRGRGNERLRYLGVDTPETVHPSEPSGCFGAEASAYNQALVAGQTVRLERDISDVDKYGRLLRYVYVGDEMVNLTLVEGGYAQVVTYPPDVRHTDTFRTAETAARDAGAGLWGDACPGEYKPRLEPVVSSSGQVPPDAACVVKGNISQTSGERIYHVPGCEYYEQTRINEVTGEQWFCSEAEALAAGWRKALNCSI